MHAFAGNRETVDVIREQLKMEPEAFDKDFQADLDAQYGKTVAGFEEWTKQMRELNQSIKDDKPPSICCSARRIWRRSIRITSKQVTHM